MQDISLLLQSKLSGFKPKRPSPRRAFELLHHHQAFYGFEDTFVFTALGAVDVEVSIKLRDGVLRNDVTLSLASTAFRIGQRLRADHPAFPTTAFVGDAPDDYAHLGALFLECLLALDYVDISYDHKRGSCYIITLKPKWFQLWDDIVDDPRNRNRLRATRFKLPRDLTASQHANDPICSRWTREEAEEVFKTLEGTQFLIGFNKVQQVPWKLNEGVFHVAQDYFRVKSKPTVLHNGGKKPFTQASKLYDKKPTASNKVALATARSAWLQERKSQQALSQFLSEEAILFKATALSGVSQFYQLCYTDFRGRIYYSEPYLNYQGCDLARSLLTFAEGTVLTYSGLQELKVHTANSFNQTYKLGELPSWLRYDYDTHLRSEGLTTVSADKTTYMDRRRWVNANWRFILQVAEHGLLCDGRAVNPGHADLDAPGVALPKAEKPWVFLACCLELTAWCSDRRNFVSTLPCAIDGTVNCLQHMAAMSRDRSTGEQVALTDTDVPTDLYLEVAKDIVQRNPAFFSQKPITMPQLRKCVAKVTVMLRCYSAGINTITEDVGAELDDAGVSTQFNLTPAEVSWLSQEALVSLSNVCPKFAQVLDFLQDLVYSTIGESQWEDSQGNVVSTYQRKKRIDAKKKLFQEAGSIDNFTQSQLDKLQEHQDYLADLTKVQVSGDGSKELGWTSPSGFPVKFRSYLVDDVKPYVVLQGLGTNRNRVRLVYKVSLDVPLLQNFLSGIGPQTIHSLDGAHLVTVAARFDGPFAGIHDSFSTVAGRVGDLRKLTNAVFVETYADTNMFVWLLNAVMSDPSKFTGTIPALGTLDLNEASNSRYFFS